MQIKNFFQKDIGRPIETVIKADDTKNISDEVAEYVITKEIALKVQAFFEAYKGHSLVNGVWISGFFGSGKSHLLKILSYVLSNKEFDGYKSGNLFAEKVEGNEILKANILAAIRIPAESVLFNIDQHAQITNKANPNAILSVFYKIFFDHLGYYGFQPHVAEFEMWVDKQGHYAAFKEKFLERSGKPWEIMRQDYFDPLVTDTVASVLGELNNTDPIKYENILDDLEDRHKQSIEDFSKRVNDYINTKPKGFRLNFFVDEIGQYISNNTKLMLNLQTIAESLMTITKGQSWILVTSQEAMEDIVGDMNKSQQNDFSRIQARFKIKVPLTSHNVEEVIEKRLLKKEEPIQTHLEATFEQEKAHLDSLLSFSEVGIQIIGYKDKKDFANKFPFPAYQFDVFKRCREELSKHNAFQGKHSSIGERSMLGVFQQVAASIGEENDRTLVSFDQMFEGIKNELKGDIQSSINFATKNLDNKFALQVLKVLFLVKYFRAFKTNKRNLSILLINDIDVDLKKHDQALTEALNTLENQSYIQRNGDFYEFLTDDEKDVEQEIKETTVDDQAITILLRELFFDETIVDGRIRLNDNKQLYEFASNIDGTLFGREKELGIEIISENNVDYANTVFHQSQTMGSTKMRIVLPSDAIFMKDLKMHLRTNKYVKQTQSTSNRIEVKRILQEKGQQNAVRRKNLRLLANKLLANATIYMNGSQYEMGQTADGKTRVIKAFQDLVKIVYPNLRMLKNINFSEDTIKSVVRDKQDELFAADENGKPEGAMEILNFINRRKKASDRTSLNDLKTHFTRKPYGWYPNAIWTLVGNLYKRAEIELKKDANLLEDEGVIQALINSSNHLNTLLEPQAVIDLKLVRSLKKIYDEAFDESCPESEAKGVANAFKNKLKEMQVTVNQLLVQQSSYPFLKSLEPLGDLLSRLTRKEYSYFLTEQASFEDELLDAKEELLNPIRRFMKGDQVKIYDEIRTMLNGNTSNFKFFQGTELDTLQELMTHSKPYAGSAIRDAKIAKDALTKQILQRIETEKQKAVVEIDRTIQDFENKEEYQKLDSAQKKQLLQPLHKEKEKVQSERFITGVHYTKSYVVEDLKTLQLNEMVKMATPLQPTEGAPKKPPIHYIRKSAIQPDFSKTELKTEADVDDYIEALRAAMKKAINDNKRINLK